MAGEHGAALIERVIDAVRAAGTLDVLGRVGLPKHAKPRGVPEAALAELRFPCGAALSPALRRWLAFDATWLGWFRDPTHPVFEPETLASWSTREYGMDWGFGSYELDGEVYALHFGADSRRCLYVGEPDSIGEHPVLLADTDDTPYLCVEAPGIDVYLADAVGLIGDAVRVYGGLIEHPDYGARMREHADRCFGGEVGREIDYERLDPEELFGTESLFPPPPPGARDPLTGELPPAPAKREASKKRPAKKKKAKRKPSKKKAAKK